MSARVFLKIYLMLALSLCAVSAQGEELDFAQNRYLFHWATENRSNMLQRFRRLEERFWRTAVGTGQNGNMSVNGVGIYTSEVPHNSRGFGPILNVIEVPNDIDVKPINKPNKRYRLITAPNPRIRFLRASVYFEAILASEHFNNLDPVSKVGLGKVLFDQRESLPNYYEQYKTRIEAENGFSITWLEDYYFREMRISNEDFFVSEDGLSLVFRRIHPPAFQISSLPSWLPTNLLENLWQRTSESYRLVSLARRFFDPEHFEQLLRPLGIGPEDIFRMNPAGELPFRLPDFNFALYGQEAFRAWMIASHHIEERSLFGAPTFEDFLRLHEIVYPEAVGDFQAFRNSAAFRTSGDYNPRGHLRNGPIYINRNSTGVDGARLPFSPEQLARLSRNPHMNVIVNSNNSNVRIQLPYTASFEDDIRSLFSTLQSELSQLGPKPSSRLDNTYRNRVAEIVGGFYWELSSRHPFWDGSGRTAKLIRDWALLSLNISPPMNTPQNDWELTKVEYVRLLSTQLISGNSRSSRMFTFNDVMQTSNACMRTFK